MRRRGGWTAWPCLVGYLAEEGQCSLHQVEGQQDPCAGGEDHQGAS